MNNLSIIGHITRDASLRTVKIGGVDTYVCDFTVAANYGRRNENGERNVTYVKCTLWREMAKNTCPYLKKGMQVAVSGAARVSVYQSQQDKTWRGALEIPTVTQFEFLSAQKREEAPAPAAPVNPADAPAEDEDYLPFA